MKILKVEPSPVKNKRLRVFLDNEKYYDFGLDTGSTYIDHGDQKKRSAYFARHFGNKTEKQLIENLVPSPALFSMFVLWGKYNSLERNIEFLNSLFAKYK
jgi:hypothetical protein